MTINVILDHHQPVNSFDVKLQDFNQISNGSISQISCHILDQLNYADRTAVFIQLLKKCKNNGEISIKFLDSLKIMRDYLDGKVSSQYFSELVKDMKSIINETDIFDIVSDNPHFSVIKKYNDNYNKIITLYKKI
jgi:hypothetical protein